MDYLLHVVVMIGIYAILAMSLDLLVGHTGLLSVAHAAFYGLGAYTSGLLSTHFHTPFVSGLLAAMCVAIVFSFFVSLPGLRLRDDYFVVATFGFQMILFSVLNNWIQLTRGPQGLTGIPRPALLGLAVDSRASFLALVLVAAVVSYVIVQRTATSPFGRVLRAIREDEVFAQALGKNTLRFKVTVAAVAAALAAVAGSLYAHYASYIDPSGFTVMESILIAAMVIVGGAGSKWGPVVGAVTLVALPELLRLVGLPGSVAASLRQVLYGAALVAMMIARPRGLAGQYGFGR